MVLCASSGTAALEAVLAAIEAGKTIALANKEVLVMAGALMTDAARRHGVEILPVDSEHNAIHQCLHGRPAARDQPARPDGVRRPVPRPLAAASWRRSAPSDALKHPTWRMGRKITIDSATLMNKGLEVIEAHWLFGVPGDRIDVVVHPQSIVHSMVEMVDGSILAQLGVTDMRLPIQYAFSYPERWPSPLPRLDLARVRPPRLPRARSREVPRAEAGLSGARGRRRAAGRAERGERGRRRAASSRAASRSRRSRCSSSGRWTRTRRPTVRSLAEARRLDRWARAYSQELARAVQSED